MTHHVIVERPFGTGCTASGGRRALFIAGGLLCVALGALGAVLPGLPTTVFLLAASYLFARSSPDLHRRLIEHRHLGPYLRLVHGRAMPRRAKVSALAAMWSGIALSMLMLGDARVIQAAVLGCGLIGTAVLLFYVRTAPESRGRLAASH